MNIVWGIIVLSSLSYHLGHDITNVISWDVYGYYLYLPALLKYCDTSQYLFALEHLSEYQVSAELYQLTDLAGIKAPIYTIGMALIYLPFYLIADLIAIIFPTIKADGMSPVYQWAIVIASWSYAYVGILYTSKLLKALKFNSLTIAATLCGIFLGSNYFHYAAFENGMPHIYLYTLYALLVYLTHLWHIEAKSKYVILGGIVIALLCLARPSEIVALLIPIFYGIYNGLSIIVKIQRIKRYRRQILLMIFSGISLILLQILFWKLNIGKWIFNGYAGHYFDFLDPHIWEGIFSFRKGWLVYSPIYFLALIGIPLLWNRDKRFFFPVTIFFILNIYIVLSWHIWWYASSFGMRALIQSYAIIALPLAATIEKMISLWWSRIAGFALILLFVAFNQFQDWQYRNGILLQDEMTKTFYWKSFLKLNKNLKLRVFVDTEEIYRATGSYVQLIGGKDPSEGQDLSVDTIPPGKFGATKRLFLKETMKDEDEKWINVSAEIMMASDKYNRYSQARLVTAIKHEDKDIKWVGVRAQWMTIPKQWETITYDFRIDNNTHQDAYLETTLWNNGPDTIYIKSIDLNQYSD